MNLVKLKTWTLAIPLVLIAISCNKAPIIPDPVDEEIDPKAFLDDLYGSYEGVLSDGKVIFFNIIPDEVTQKDFRIRNYQHLTYPFAEPTGNIVGDTLYFENIICNNCPFLPSPGGNPRTYSRTLKNRGKFFPSADSLRLDIDFQQTGMSSGTFVGQAYLKKKK
jgi:hypothetical protein